jgi:hypothetical protein
MSSLIKISINQGNITHHGTLTTVEKDNEFQNLVNLGEDLQFYIRLSDDGYWETENTTIDPLLVMAAGESIENMEDLSDILSELNTLRK